MRDHRVIEEQAKWVLYNAIVGQSSRLVISSMNPELPASQHIEFREYLRRMGEKFTPAAESIQNFINARHKLFQLAFLNAQERDWVEFYREMTEGFIKKYIQDQMFCYKRGGFQGSGSERGADREKTDLDRRHLYQQDGGSHPCHPTDQRR